MSDKNFKKSAQQSGDSQKGAKPSQQRGTSNEVEKSSQLGGPSQQEGSFHEDASKSSKRGSATTPDADLCNALITPNKEATSNKGMS